MERDLTLKISSSGDRSYRHLEDALVNNMIQQNDWWLALFALGFPLSFRFHREFDQPQIEKITTRWCQEADFDGVCRTFRTTVCSRRRSIDSRCDYECWKTLFDWQLRDVHQRPSEAAEGPVPEVGAAQDSGFRIWLNARGEHPEKIWQEAMDPRLEAEARG